MLLINIKNYLKDHRMVTLFELSKHFNIEPDSLRSMLQFLILKGQIRQQIKKNNCGKQCIKCHPLATEVFEWIKTKDL